jgi:hypothetical protein
MTWSTLGWILVGLSAVLLIIFTSIRKAQGSYEVREVSAIQQLLSARSAAVEEGNALHLGLGQRMFSGLYPGAGLYSLSILPNYLNREIRNSGAMSVSSGDGVLAVLARQIIQNQYGDGYSFLLDQHPVPSNLPGPTPLSSTAGLLNLLSFDKYASVALVGNYGVESVLFSEATQGRGGAFFSAVGNLTAQAALYPSTTDLLIGENVYLLSGSLRYKDAFPARFITEDILRIVVMMILVTAVFLKLLGLL